MRIRVSEGTGGAGLHVETLSYRRDAISTSFYGLWLLEISNRSAKPVCFVEFDLSAKNSAGLEVATAHGFAKTLHYTTGTAGIHAPCIPANGKGAALDNYFGAGPIPSPTEVAALDITLSGLDVAVAPSPLEPTVTSTSVVPVFGDWGVTGTLRAVQTIDFPRVDVFPRSSAGYLLDWLSDVYLEGGATYTLPADQSWAFTTEGYATTFSQFALFSDFSVPSTAAAALDVISNTRSDSSRLRAKQEQYRASAQSEHETLKRRSR